jgi:hypothetical protein
MLEMVTLTGAENSTEQEDLFRLSALYPIVEWGVLFHGALHGSGRYPSITWIEKLCAQMRRFQSTRFALHICGQDALLEFLNGVGKVSMLAEHFPRIQLNLNASRVDVRRLDDTIQKHPEKIFITQHNHINEDLWNVLREHENHAVLFDESGGKGISPANWSTPFPHKRCGYAGGLGLDNLKQELPRVECAAASMPFWVDMEAKLRNNLDQFDVSVAHECLSICNAFLVQRR